MTSRDPYEQLPRYGPPVDLVTTLAQNLIVTDANISGAASINVRKIGLGPRVRLTHSVAQAATTGVGLQVAFDTSVFVSDGMYSSASNTRITFNTPGVYMVGAEIEWAGSAAGTLRLSDIRVNGSLVIVADTHIPQATANGISISTLYAFNGGDYAEVIGIQDSGGNLNINHGIAYSPVFWAYYVGPLG